MARTENGTAEVNTAIVKHSVIQYFNSSAIFVYATHAAARRWRWRECEKLSWNNSFDVSLENIRPLLLTLMVHERWRWENGLVL